MLPQLTCCACEQACICACHTRAHVFHVPLSAIEIVALAGPRSKALLERLVDAAVRYMRARAHASTHARPPAPTSASTHTRRTWKW